MGRIPALPNGAALTGPMLGAGVHGVRREERHQVLGDRDRPDTGTAAAVRDAERLVEIEVGDVAAETTRLGQAEQRVEIGAVDVDLATVLVHERTHVPDALLVDAVRRRVGHHDRRQSRAMLLALGPEVLQVDRAVLEGGDDNDLHSGHHRRGCIGAMGTRRDQAHVAL
jgi:hypothetical protein